MRRAYFFYILMTVLLGGGLFVVLEAGRSLCAPDDLSGDWTITCHYTLFHNDGSAAGRGGPGTERVSGPQRRSSGRLVDRPRQ